MDNIKIVRLKSGEDIVGVIREDDYGKLYVEDPMEIEFHIDNRKTKQMIVLTHWAPIHIIKTNEAAIYDTDILTTFEPNEAFVEYYQSSVITMDQLRKRTQEVEDMSDDDINTLITAMAEKEEQTIH